MKRLLSLIALLCLSSQAEAQEDPPCAPSDALMTELRNQFGETVTAAGVLKDAYIVITTNTLTQTFTILLRRNDGTSCILTAGRGFAVGDPEVTGKTDL